MAKNTGSIFVRMFEEVRQEAVKNNFTSDDIIETFTIILSEEYDGMSESFIAQLVAMTCAEFELYVQQLAERRAENERKREEQRAKRAEQARKAREAAKNNKGGKNSKKEVSLSNVSASDITTLLRTFKDVAQA